jgi:transcriptional regulator with XRE-family HTH domain
METTKLVGARIRRARQRRGLEQQWLAAYCGITADYLSKIEGGKRTPSPDVLVALADRLKFTVDELLTGAVPSAPAASPLTDRCASGVAAGLTGTLTGVIVEVADLRSRVDQAWLTWQTSPTRYSDVEPVLPALIADTETTLRSLTGQDAQRARRAALRTAADLYGLLRSYCRRASRPDLALMSADRAIRAAEAADDPLGTAIARWNLAHALLAAPGSADHAEHVALDAINHVRAAGDTPQLLAAEGALHLVAVVAAAQAGRPRHARERLQEHAQPLAERAADTNVGHTCFGEANVRLHNLSAMMHAGDAGEGLRLADATDIRGLPPERQFTFTMETAQLYHQLGVHPAVLNALLTMEALLPEDLGRNPTTVSMVMDLITRASFPIRRSAEDLAARLQLI